MDINFELEMSNNTLNLLYPPAQVMVYFNNVINPVICFIVCKSVRDDMKYFISVFARRVRRCYIRGRSQQEVLTSNEDSGTRANENIEITSRSAALAPFQTLRRRLFNGVHEYTFRSPDITEELDVCTE